MIARTTDESSLTDIERALVDHVRRGALLDLAAGEPVDEAAMRAWDESHIIRADVIRDIVRGRLAPDPDPHGLRLRGARIVGRLDLENVTSGIGFELYSCWLDEGLTARDATLAALVLSESRFEHPSEPPLDLDRLTAVVLFFNDAVITAHCKFGAVGLAGAHIGTVACDAATIRNDAGPALDAERMQVDQTVFLRGEFNAVGAGEDGAIRLVAAHIAGVLDFTDAIIRNDTGPAVTAQGMKVDQNVLLSDGFKAISGGGDVTVNLSDVRIGGVLVFDPARLEHTADPQSRLAVDGLTYTGLPKGISSDDWLRLLRDATPSYAAQPYQQLATAHRAAGHDGKARNALMAQRRDQINRRALTGRAERAWARLTGLTIGYGYQPWRALVALVGVAAAAVTLAVALGAYGGLARIQPQPPSDTACSAVEIVGVGLELGLPLIKTGSRTHCDTTSSAAGQVLTVTGWGLQLLAWAFATLFVAGFTGAVRKT